MIGNIVKDSSYNFVDSILRLVQTEKSVSMNENMNKYVIEVRTDANKTAVKLFFENVLKVKVLKVNSLNRKGKLVSFKRCSGFQSDKKYMIVSVKKGEVVDFNLKV